MSPSMFWTYSSYVLQQAAQGEPRLWLTVTTLVAIQLGWGLWLTPYGYARMGWGGATLAIIVWHLV